MTERRGRDRLQDRDLAVDVKPNAAGGVVVKVTHLPSRRFTTETGKSREVAERKAKDTLTGILARLRRRREKGMSELP
jgi:hypothetical protein